MRTYGRSGTALADLVVHGFPFHPTAESLKRLGDVMEAIEKAQIALDPEVKPYTIPGGQVIGVDKDLDISVLDRLNALPGMKSDLHARRTS